MNEQPLSNRSEYRLENRPAAASNQTQSLANASLLGEHARIGQRDCDASAAADNLSKLLKADCSGSRFKSQFTVEQIAKMKRRHDLTHPWQRGYRNHKAVREAKGA